MKNSLDIYNFLKKQNLLEDSPTYWWPNSGSFEVIVGAVLTQNTTWTNVEKSLSNLDGHLCLDSFLTLSEVKLKEKIKPSGFYNQKAPRIIELAKNIKLQFQDFKIFQKQVTREWLLSQKGIGKESADAILCYACFRDVMVVDTYTKRLLKSFGVEFKNYDTYQKFLEDGIRENNDGADLNLVFSRFHGMIVEYNKINKLKPL